MPDTTQDDTTMPATVADMPVVSAFRHLPSYGRFDYSFTVILDQNEQTKDIHKLYTLARVRWSPAACAWIKVFGESAANLTWSQATSRFARAVMHAA